MTIIELAVLFMVMAVVAAFAVPQALNYMKAYRLGVAARNLATAIQRARYLATSNNTRAGISIARDRVDIQQYDLENKRKPENKGLVILPEGISISSDAPKEIAFDGRGLVTPLPTRNLAIRVNGANGYHATVTVYPTGQVSVSEVERDEQ